LELYLMNGQKSKNKNWYKIFSKSEAEQYQSGIVTTQIIEEKKAIALVKDGDTFHAIDNSCAHQGGPLGEGTLKNISGKTYIVCPWHGYEYDYEGKAPPGYDDCVNSYATEMREDGLYIELPELPIQDTISDQIVDVLVTWGVKHVFGMIGHSNLAMGEALRKRKSDITFIGVRHEGAASFAASAYGKLTGDPGVCLTIAGPGATNLLTGLYDAKLDRSPVLALTGQIDTQFLGPGAFQEVDLTGAFSDVTIWQQTVLTSENASELTALALKHAILQRNVTQLALPDEIQKLPGTIKKTPRYGRIPSLTVPPDPVEYEKVKKIIKNAKYLSIIVGHGARKFRKEIETLAEKLDCAIITTFKAKGAISDHHPLGCGVLGSSGTPVGSSEVNDSDVLLVLGASFSEKTAIPENKKIIQVDTDPLTLGKRKPVTLPVLADIGQIVTKLCEDLPEGERNSGRKEKIQSLKEDWRLEKKKRSTNGTSKEVLHPASIFNVLSKLIPHDAVITVDVGNNAYAFGRYFEVREQEIVLSGYLGSIGYAFPAALGACMARPEKKIIAVAGDGGFGQYLGEFLTAVHYNLPIILVLLNNNQLGKISNEQLAENFPVFATNLTNPDFAKYANLCGGYGYKVTSEKELEEAIENSLRSDKPTIIEVVSDPNAT
jgi:thiamine pyrophosphate-dependent acetolactate synthase large subunit-like protein/nitrite reductase/ring-hydroxylating ferredoxin subunit